MILECPECNKKFSIPDDALGEDGRKVRCAACKHVWHQDPIPEEAAAEPVPEPAPEPAPEPESPEDDTSNDLAEKLESIAEEIEDEQNKPEDEEPVDEKPQDDFSEIPDAARPDAETNEGSEEAPSENNKKPKFNLPPALAQKVGAAIAAAIIIIICTVFFMARPSIVSAMPSTYPLYALFSPGFELPGEGLVFDQVVVASDGEGLSLSGRIINLTTEEKEIPAIEATLVDGDGERQGHFVFHTEAETLAPESDMEFKHKQALEGEATPILELRFILGH